MPPASHRPGRPRDPASRRPDTHGSHKAALIEARLDAGPAATSAIADFSSNIADLVNAADYLRTRSELPAFSFVGR